MGTPPHTPPRWRRFWWLALVLLLLVAQSLLVWLTLVFEAGRQQERIDTVAASTATALKHQLTDAGERVLALTRLPGGGDTAGAWERDTRAFFDAHREAVRLERRDHRLRLQNHADSPWHPRADADGARDTLDKPTELACVAARHTPGLPVHAGSRFVRLPAGRGVEATDLCLAQIGPDGRPVFWTATLSLKALLEAVEDPAQARQHELSFVQTDGTRLARAGVARGTGAFVAERAVDAQGLNLQLRVDSVDGPPSLIPNLSTALVLGLSLSLFGVVVLLARDVRRRLAAEAALADYQERLQASARLATMGEMASLLSHELNQPLAAIDSFATASQNLMALQPPPPDLDSDLRRALHHITEQAERAGSVIRSVHNLVRRGEPRRETVAVPALFDGILPLVRLQARRYGATVEVVCAAGAEAVWCERTALEQVLLNLARNGLQAMAHTPPERARLLRITVQPETGGRIGFEVCDNGEGVSDAIAARLYTPFFTTRPDGMGMGLSMCRTMVEQHGGQLVHHNRHGAGGQPVGTCFAFSLPAAPGPTPQT